MPGSEFEPRSPLHTRHKRHIACDEFFVLQKTRPALVLLLLVFPPDPLALGSGGSPVLHLLMQVRFSFGASFAGGETFAAAGD